MNRSASLASRLAFTDRNSNLQVISSQELLTRSRFQCYPGCETGIWNELVLATVETTGAIDAHMLRRRLDSSG